MKRSGIRSKIIRGVLIVSLAAAAVTGLLGYLSGRSVLTSSIFDRLTGLRVTKSYHVENYVRMVRNHVLAVSDDPTAADAVKAFEAGMKELAGTPLTADQEAALKTWYDTAAVPAIREHGDFTGPADSLMPKSTAARCLQFHRLVESQGEAGANRQADPVAASKWLTAHRRYHPVFERIRSLFGYDDVLLISAETREVVYAAAGDIDLGASFETGPFATSGLAKAVREVLASDDDDTVRIVDFEPYVGYTGLPAAFAVTGIFDGPKHLGVLAFQFPIDRIDRILSGQDRWAEQGLGETGEIYLIGEDGFMRNHSRFLTKDPETYARLLTENGVPRESVDKMLRYGTSIMTVKLDSPLIRDVFQGQSGTKLAADYMGDESLSSYSPLDVEGLRWGIVAKIGADEAFRPLRRFERLLALCLAGIGALTALAAAIAGARLAAPIRQITQATRAFAGGFYDVRVKLDSRDEVEELAESFNSMAREITSKTSEYRAQVQENRRLLENMMPAAVMARMRGRGSAGDDAPFRTEVTLAFLEIGGLFRLYERLEPLDASARIEALIDAIDAAADRHGVEKLNASGAGYLAACGLTEPQFDHSQRVLAFVEDAVRSIETFNETNDATPLFLSAGVHRGPVTNGKLGRQAFVDELWARTIDLAMNTEELSGQSQVRVSDDVHERVSNDPALRFEQAEAGHSSHGPVWRLM